MKKIINLFLLTIVIAGAFTACNEKNQPAVVSAKSTAEETHQHSYRCPMNCEKGKTYNEPGQCPVCGMNLEHFDEEEDNGLVYKMEFSSIPEEVSAGQNASFAFRPKIVGQENEAVALDLQHEKKIHLIIVNDDLSYFEHIHPEYEAGGSYQIRVLPKQENFSDGEGKNETKFEYGGNYTLFADYKPTGGSHQVEKVNFKVKGNSRPAVKFSQDKLSGTSSDYSVTLVSQTGELVSGKAMQIAATVSKNGKEINANTLEDYLGAKAHMVVISLDDKEYLHVHPGVADGKFTLNTNFKNPGIYRGWIQFQADGKVHTIDFTLSVKQGQNREKKES